MIYLSVALLLVGVLIGFCLNNFVPGLGKGKSFLLAGVFVIVVASFLFYKIYRAAHELPPGAKPISKSDVTKDL
jgi:high-affinity Fe2+/Pb2+ permease